MFRRARPHGMIAVTLLTLATFAAGPEARAGGPPHCGHDEWVTVTREVEVPDTRVITLYDHCGRPYQVETTAYRTVRVTVRRRVLVYD